MKAFMHDAGVLNFDVAFGSLFLNVLLADTDATIYKSLRKVIVHAITGSTTTLLIPVIN